MDSIIFTDINAAPGFGRYGGAYRIASEIRSMGFSCQVIEFFSELSLEEIESVFDKFLTPRTKFIGFSTTLWVKNQMDTVDIWTTEKRPIRFVVADLNKTLFPQPREFMLEVFASAKHRNPRVKLVVGGQKAKKGQYHADYPEIDHWIVGQGEGCIHNIMFDDMSSPRIMSDKFFPFADFNVSQTLYAENDIILPGEHLPIEVARGCAFKCAFCAFDLNGKRPGEYTKSPDVLRDEIMRNYDLHGTTAYMISDDTPNDSVQKIEALHEMITSLPFKFEFSSYLRLDLMAHEPRVATLLHEMGLRSCQFGMETLNPETGQAVGKGMDPSKQKDLLHSLKEQWGDDVYIGAGFIAGLPHETPKSMQATLDWLDEEDTPLDSCQVVPLVVTNDSKIGMDPTKYEYSEGANLQSWTNSNMTYNEAKDIVLGFYDGGHKRKRNLTSFHFYSRFRNLGYSHEECGNIYMDDVAKIHETEDRRTSVKRNYFARLLA